jgi:hypothetical protein
MSTLLQSRAQSERCVSRIYLATGHAASVVLIAWRFSHTRIIANADPPLLRPFSRPVTLRHRRHDLAPHAHADLSHHRRHRTDSVTPSQSSARRRPLTLWLRQCAQSASIFCAETQLVPILMRRHRRLPLWKPIQSFGIARRPRQAPRSALRSVKSRRSGCPRPSDSRSRSAGSLS